MPPHSSKEVRHRGRSSLPDGQWRTQDPRRRAETVARPGHPRGSRPHRHPHRLRHEPVRRVHGPCRWPGREVVHDARPPGRWRRGHDDRGHGELRRAAPPAPDGVLGEARPAVRLLHAGHDHDRGRPAGPQPRSERGRDPARHRGQPVPLHRLPQHRRSRSRPPPRPCETGRPSPRRTPDRGGHHDDRRPRRPRPPRSASRSSGPRIRASSPARAATSTTSSSSR